MGKLVAEWGPAMLLLLGISGWFFFLPAMRSLCRLGTSSQFMFWELEQQHSCNLEDKEEQSMAGSHWGKKKPQAGSLEAATIFLRPQVVQGNLASCPKWGSCLWLLIHMYYACWYYTPDCFRAGFWSNWLALIWFYTSCFGKPAWSVGSFSTDWNRQCLYLKYC